jgi:hypothetical protein
MNNPFNIGNNYLNIPSYMNNIPMNKIYICTNCKIFYTLNECFDPINNKHYNEHSFKLQNYENNNIKENNNGKNKDKNKHLIKDFFKKYKGHDKNVENKKNDIEINNNEKNKEDKEAEYYCIYGKFDSILYNYFFNEDRKLKNEIPSEDEKNIVNCLYINLLEKNIAIKDIEEYQNNYILSEINPLIEKLSNNDLTKFNNRVDSIKKLINDLYNLIYT